ncbi:MAG: GAF domain-containing protein [Deltaproteobacteria bacterium]|nr:GAF domain-containing protein [Deltaproteobacteria bacterium]
MMRLLRWLVAPLGRLRLRHKLALSLSIAALVPVAVVATIAGGVVLGGLERGLESETQRQLDVGLNLLLRTVERYGADAVRVASTNDLSRAMATGKGAVSALIAREAPLLPAALVQVKDASGQAVLDQVIGGDTARFEGLGLAADAPLVRAGQAWAQRVNLDVITVPTPDGAPGEPRLVVRAVAPIVDESFALQGVVVLSVPLDADFADAIKGALGAEVMIAPRTATEALSTFRDPLGERAPTVAIGTGIAAQAAAGRRVLATAEISGGEYAVAWTALVDVEDHPVGLFGVAIDRGPVASAKQVAFRSLAIGGAVALGFALALAAWLGRRLGAPIARLHRGAIAVARGDLDHAIDIPRGDEIGELAEAFAHMTTTLKENQQRLAARMREIVALHDAGRAVSSVIDLDQVLRKIVDSVARTFDVRLCALWVASAGADGAITLRLGAARSLGRNLRTTLMGSEGAIQARPLLPLAAEVAQARRAILVPRLAEDERRAAIAQLAGIDGSLLAAPLERKGVVVGVIVVGRNADHRSFSDADANLLATFADQAAAAVENARLYDEVRGSSEELERKVRLRTSELTAMNQELGKALADLRDAQAQLILSERLAGLGLLVAGVAHEVNSPSAAIRGSADAMGEVVRRLTSHTVTLAELQVAPEIRRAVIEAAEALAPIVAQRRLPTGAGVRRAARELRGRIDLEGIADPAEIALALVEVGAEPDEAIALCAACTGPARPQLIPLAVGYLTEAANLHRNAHVIQAAIRRIQRIVGALKTYSHLDQQATSSQTDLHEGIEITLALLDYALRDIVVTRRFGRLPLVPAYVDELNQVWTNLIQNAVQALKGRGSIAIETEPHGPGVMVRIIDDGPGIPADVMPRIFEPFFTTKPKGEGTGLGLGIVRQIVEKHGGTVRCESVPGRTAFEVWLPIGAGVAPRAATPVPVEADLAAEVSS